MIGDAMADTPFGGALDNAMKARLIIRRRPGRQ
jgi:hypothetical protein